MWQLLPTVFPEPCTIRTGKRRGFHRHARFAGRHRVHGGGRELRPVQGLSEPLRLRLHHLRQGPRPDGHGHLARFEGGKPPMAPEARDCVVFCHVDAISAVLEAFVPHRIRIVWSPPLCYGELSYSYEGQHSMIPRCGDRLLLRYCLLTTTARHEK